MALLFKGGSNVKGKEVLQENMGCVPKGTKLGDERRCIDRLFCFVMIVWFYCLRRGKKC